MWRIGTNFSQMWRIGTKNLHAMLKSLNSHICEKVVSNRHMWKKCIKTLTWEELEPNFPTSVKFVPNYMRCEELVLNCHIWQRQNIEELESNAKCTRIWGYILSVWGYACMLYEIWLHEYFTQHGDIGTEYVTYWYQFLTCCGILRGEIFSTDSSKCEIYCDSIKPFVPRFQQWY